MSAPTADDLRAVLCECGHTVLNHVYFGCMQCQGSPLKKCARTSWDVLASSDLFTQDDPSAAADRADWIADKGGD